MAKLNKKRAAKVTEEAGELLHVLGKGLATKDLVVMPINKKIIEEAGDLYAALDLLFRDTPVVTEVLDRRRTSVKRWK